jgi:hypothetical protein
MTDNSMVVGVAESDSILDIAIDKSPLNAEQARQVTHSIRDAAEVIWILIARAHAGKAWKALGYDSWEEYVKTEFNMSRSRSYQLLDQAKVISEIAAALPQGAEVKISEAAARELKVVLEEAVPEIRKATEGLDKDEAVKVTEDILSKYREKAHDAVDPVFEVEAEEETDVALQPSSHLIYSTESETEIPKQATEIDARIPLQPAIPSVIGESLEKQSHDLAKIRKLVNASHDIYSSLTALSGLPEEIDQVIEAIPRERYDMIDKNLDSAIEKLEIFKQNWLNIKNSLGNDNESK